MTNIVSIHKVKKAFGDKVILKDVSLVVTEGEIYGLLGVNGAGKSTLIDCILGIKDINSGEIRVLGEKPGKKNKKLFEKIGVQFQQTNYQDKIKVNELCTVTSSYYKTPKDWRKLLQLFSLEGKESQYVHSLSGGEKQKLSILLTIIPNPKIVFLDELTTGLDTYARRLIWEQLLQLKSEGLTIYLTSHYMDEVELLCDRVGILKDGEIEREGTVSELIETSGEKTLEDAFLRYTKEENHETF